MIKMKTQEEIKELAVKLYPHIYWSDGYDKNERARLSFINGYNVALQDYIHLPKNKKKSPTT